MINRYCFVVGFWVFFFFRTSVSGFFSPSPPRRVGTGGGGFEVGPRARVIIEGVTAPRGPLLRPLSRRRSWYPRYVYIL